MYIKQLLKNICCLSLVRSSNKIVQLSPGNPRSTVLMMEITTGTPFHRSDLNLSPWKSKLLLISINFTPKTSHSCLKNTVLSEFSHVFQDGLPSFSKKLANSKSCAALLVPMVMVAKPGGFDKKFGVQG